MKVLVDTSVWSLALRRNLPYINMQIEVQQLTELILASLVVMVGPVRQELLSGISDESTYMRLKDKLDAWGDLQITTEDYVTAASFYNKARKRGIQGSHVDFLLCAIAFNHKLIIFTTDKDFDHYADILPIRLFKP